MIAFLVGHVLVDATGLSWRVILGSSTIIAVILFIARLGLPESPRWLWNQGRRYEARAIAHRYMERRRRDRRGARGHPNGQFRDAVLPQYWRATLFTSKFWFCAVTP
jgi:MFS transporter, putative metabolite transport protein